MRCTCIYQYYELHQRPLLISWRVLQRPVQQSQGPVGNSNCTPQCLHGLSDNRNRHTRSIVVFKLHRANAFTSGCISGKNLQHIWPRSTDRIPFSFHTPVIHPVIQSKFLKLIFHLVLTEIQLLDTYTVNLTCLS